MIEPVKKNEEREGEPDTSVSMPCRGRQREAEPFDNLCGPSGDWLARRVETWNALVVNEGWEIQIRRGSQDNSEIRMGQTYLQPGNPIIVGMSLGNSYFSPENVGRLFRFLETLNTEIYLVVMDKPSEHNYRALGYSEDKIAQRIKKKGSELFRSIDSALKQIGEASGRFRIVEWDSIRASQDFQVARKVLEELYCNSDPFRTDMRAAVFDYIAPKLHGNPITEEIYESAVKYLLEEFAFLTCSPKLLGRKNPVYLYHKTWPIFENLINGKYDQCFGGSLGFVQLGVVQS